MQLTEFSINSLGKQFVSVVVLYENFNIANFGSFMFVTAPQGFPAKRFQRPSFVSRALLLAVCKDSKHHEISISGTSLFPLHIMSAVFIWKRVSCHWSKSLSPIPYAHSLNPHDSSERLLRTVLFMKVTTHSWMASNSDGSVLYFLSFPIQQDCATCVPSIYL